MTWLRLDDQAAFHRKVIDAGNEAFGAWVRGALTSSAQQLDGFVPRKTALAIGPVELWDQLVAAKAGGEVGLAVEVENGWQIHDYLQWNPSAAETKATRSATAKRTATWRERGTKRPVSVPLAAPSQPAPVTSRSAVAPTMPAPAAPLEAPAPTPRPVPPPPIQPPLLTLCEPPAPTPTERVFAAYVDGWRAAGRSGSPPRLDDKRKKMIAARLKDYPPEDLARAAGGIWLSTWHLENNQTSIDLALRDSAHVEQFRDISERPSLGTRPSSLQSSAAHPTYGIRSPL